MTTFGYFELYATFIGWFLYGEGARFFINSGLIAVIPLLLYFKTYGDATVGQQTKSGMPSAVNYMSYESLRTALFIMFFFLPWVTINPSQVTFELSDGQAVNIENNESAFQGRFSSSDYENVRAPLAWVALMKVSGGINTFFLNMFPETQNLREEVMTLERLSIKDPVLSKQVNRFHDECFSKGLHYFKKQELQETPIETDPDDGDTPFWPGSKTMLGIYGQFNACTQDCKPVFRADKPVAGFGVDPRVDVEPEYSQGGETIGRPLCSVWWNNKLKEDIYDEAVKNGVGSSFFISIKSFFSNPSDEEMGNVIVKEAMTNQQSVQVTNPNMQYADHGRVSGGWIQSMTSALGTKYEGFKTGSATYQIIRSLPIMQGLLLMMLYFSLPILMFVSKLNLKTFAIVIIGYFGIRFLTVLWHFAYWLDEFFLASSMPEGMGDDGIFTGFDGAVFDKASLDFILILGYIVIPILFYVLLGWVGFRALSTGDQAMAGEAKKSSSGSNAVTNAALNKIKGGVGK